MQLLSLSLFQFRCFREAYFEFSPRINLIYGENAQGKTSLLEAISVLMTGRSFRTPNLSDLIQKNCPYFHVEARFKKHGVEQKLSFASDGGSKKIIYNSTRLSSVRSLFGLLNGVILTPEDNELIKGGPATRRQFLDLQIGQTNPLYLYHLARYMKAMKQRNFLLRHRDYATIEVWENQMASSAGPITIDRQKMANYLGFEKDLLQERLNYLDQISLNYKSTAWTAGCTSLEAIQDYYLGQYKKNRFRESEMRCTLSGPHRDDLLMSMHEKEARFVASEGQKRSCVAMLRIADWKRIKEATGETPIMCVDDVSISLDEKREESLFKLLHEMGQVFLTAPTTKLGPNFQDIFPLLVQKTSETDIFPI